MPEKRDEAYEAYKEGVKNGVYQTEIKYLATDIGRIDTKIDALSAEIKNGFNGLPCDNHNQRIVSGEKEFVAIKSAITATRIIGGIILAILAAATPFIIYILNGK